jgi:hypothetical protein
VILILGVAAGLVAASGATAKDLRPGDLRICNHHRCIAIRKHSVVRLLGPFYYTGGTPPPAARAPRLGAPAFQLRFRNGYVTGIVATARLDRFLSYGVDLGRFAPGRWYRLPRRVARELRRLAAPVEPLRVTRRALARSR